MKGTCWRLLAAFLLILLAELLSGQRIAPDHGPTSPASVASRASIEEWPQRDARGEIGPHPVVRNPIVGGPVSFSQIVENAGIIFSGHVTAVARAPLSSRPSSTAITFQVERAMRGTTAGERLVIHEWAGLWSAGERYRVGEHVLLFLYFPSKLNLTSPVAGAAGRFSIDPAGKIIVSPLHSHLLAADSHLARKPILSYADFEQAVRRSSREEPNER